MWNELKEQIKRKPVRFAVSAAIAIIAVMIILYDNRSDVKENTVNSEYSELAAYTGDMENRLEEIVNGINGVENAKVMITFESSFENIYASNARLEETKTDNGDLPGKTTEKQMVLAGGGVSGETPVLLKRLCPKVKGVTVVCAGADNAHVKKSITEAAVSLFGISETKVCVTASGKEKTKFP